tara:strand:- start:280 stop:543 length:264 start_codon:yes stop_codon:yes gene_type:complete
VIFYFDSPYRLVNFFSLKAFLGFVDTGVRGEEGLEPPKLSECWIEELRELLLNSESSSVLSYFVGLSSISLEQYSTSDYEPSKLKEE